MPKYKGKKSREEMIDEAMENPTKTIDIDGRKYTAKQLKEKFGPLQERRGWILEKYEHPRPLKL